MPTKFMSLIYHYLETKDQKNIAAIQNAAYKIEGSGIICKSWISDNILKNEAENPRRQQPLRFGPAQCSRLD